MSLEFSVSRLLIPVFGSSIYTWGSLIGVILAGLSLGYHVGGRLADKKDPSFVKFCSILFSTGLYIVFLPFISPLVLDITASMAATTLENSRYTSLLAAFILLVIPTFLLGIVSPYAVKLATKTLSKLGNTSGNLYSASTIGSIVGTFLTVFVLIPAFEIRYIIFALGLTLILSSLIGLGRRRFPYVLTGFVVVVLLLFTSNTLLAGIVQEPPHLHSGILVFEKETPYSHLDVVDSGIHNNIRTLYLNGLVHSKMYKDNPNELVATYTKYFPLGLIFNSDAKNVLFVGGGGFSGPKHFLNTYQNVSVDVVEIDPVVIDAAKKYFNVSGSNSNDDNPGLRIYNEDARDFLSKSNQKYDIIILDAFSKSYVPFHLMTLEFIGSLGERGEDTSDLYRAVYKTMLEVFPSVYVFPIEFKSGSNQNILLVASKNQDIKYGKDGIKQLQHQHQKILTSNTLDIDYANHLYDSTNIKTNDVPILTDQFAPVENLLNPITNKPYDIEKKEKKEEQGIATDTKIEMYYPNEGAFITFVIFALIIGIWIFYLQRIWKERQEDFASYT
ncbi:MAG: speE [Nitrososphaeraceae archaeon]|nr:speE [Nitrososphaeraceae archaeon]